MLFLIWLGPFLISPVLAATKTSIEDYDHFIFSQAWPITSCIEHKSKTPHASCNLYPNMTSWSIHGLWPTKAGTRGPNFCNRSLLFNETQLVSIEPYLIKYWPNVYADQAETSLWKHEWTKHGTCAIETEALNSEFKYFSKGLELARKYDIVGFLGAKQIYPDDVASYETLTIYNAITYFTGTSVIMDCIYDKEKKVQEISQIKLCFNLNLDLIDCEPTRKETDPVPGNCPKDGVVYPSSVISNHLKYNYPRDLAKKHSSTWMDTRGMCQSWLCEMFTAFEFLSVV